MVLLVIPPSFFFEIVGVDARSRPRPSVRIRPCDGWYARGIALAASASGGDVLSSRSEGGVQWKGGSVQIRAHLDEANPIKFTTESIPFMRFRPARRVSARRFADFKVALVAAGFHIVDGHGEAADFLANLARDSFSRTFGRWQRCTHRFYDWHFKRSVEAFLLCVSRCHITGDAVDAIIAAAAPEYRRATFSLVS